MNSENKNDTFSYTYSPKQQEEIAGILQKYIPNEESIADKLRRLDKHAEQPGMIASITTGIIGTLLLGVGMCCTMEWTDFFAIGVIIGVIGIALIVTAYPLFIKITKKQREKIAPQIIELGEKLKLGEKL